jgi:hypothetical protein
MQRRNARPNLSRPIVGAPTETRPFSRKQSPIALTACALIAGCSRDVQPSPSASQVGRVSTPEATSSSVATAPSPAPKPPRLTAPRRIEDIDAVLEDHRFTNAIQRRVSGHSTSADVNVRAKRRAMEVARSSRPHGHKVDWEILTGSPVHVGPTTGGDWETEDSSTFIVFGVDSLNGDGTLNANGGITSGVLNPSSLATSTAALFVINNLFTAEPTLVGSALSASYASFGNSYLITDVSGTVVYALSQQGNLYCLTLPTLGTCEGSWPYSVGSTVTWSAPYPDYDYSTGAITALYFGDDAGKLHCVEGSTANAGGDCWTPAQLATTNPKPRSCSSAMTSDAFSGSRIRDRLPSPVRRRSRSGMSAA